MPRKVRKWSKRLLFVSGALLLLQYLLASSTLTSSKSKWTPERVLVLTAHPDDEVMFFAPAILALTSASVVVHGLCLSNGNADNIGSIRSSELRASYSGLGVRPSDVTLIDDPTLQDGMDAVWDPQTIAGHVIKQSEARGPYDAILTFDHGGVSRHANHIACNRAVNRLATAHMLTGTRFYVLRTHTILLKFLSLPVAILQHASARVLATWLSPFTSARATPGLLQPSRPSSLPPDTLTFLSTPSGYLQALRAMTKHRSQLVWFRYLYVVFSSYMFGVQLNPIR